MVTSPVLNSFYWNIFHNHSLWYCHQNAENILKKQYHPEFVIGKKIQHLNLLLNQLKTIYKSFWPPWYQISCMLFLIVHLNFKNYWEVIEWIHMSLFLWFFQVGRFWFLLYLVIIKENINSVSSWIFHWEWCKI